MVVDPSTAYLDHAAATPLDPRVRAAMLPFLGEVFGNPEGLHEWARRPSEAVEHARGQVAALLGGRPEEVVFTAGDTESRNLAVKGVAAANRHRGSHLVISAVEHPATIAACRTLTRTGAELTVVPVDTAGRPSPHAVAAAVRDGTVLVSVCHGQAEIGTVLDVAAVCAAVHAAGPDIAVHVDAGATAGLLPIDVAAWGADLVSIGGGSLFGPRWCGALWVRDGVRIHPLIEGGLQERGKRGGAQDVASIAGLGVAAELAAAEQHERASAMAGLAARLVAGLTTVGGVRLNGPAESRVPGHVQVSVEGVEGESLTLLLAAAGVACSPGSACGAAGKASPVLEAIGLDAPWTHSAVLFTLAPTTTDREIDVAVAAFADAVVRLRAMSPAAP